MERSHRHHDDADVQTTLPDGGAQTTSHPVVSGGEPSWIATFRESVEWAVRSVLLALAPFLVQTTLRLLRPLTLTRDELRTYAARHGWLHEYASSETLRLDAPESASTLHGKIDERVGTHHLPRPFVCELEECELVGSYPVALTADNRLVEGAVVREYLLVRHALALGRDLVTRPLRTLGLRGETEEYETACLLFNSWSSGYFHWMFESVTRLQGVEQYREETGRDPTLVLGPNPSSWQRQTLELLGYDEDDWTTWSGARATVRRLVVPANRRTHVLSPGAVQWLRERVRDRIATGEIDVDPADYPDRVYVSRADADRRRVVNEDELVDALAEFGFERVVLSELPVAEQVALYAGADVVVAPHGAGLTNALFGVDLTVLELFKRGDVRGQYFQLMSICGFEYHYERCEPVRADIRVDVDRVRERIATVVADDAQT